MDMLLSFFGGISFKIHANLISINGNIKESLLESTVSAIVALLKSCDSPRCSHTHACAQPRAPSHIHLWQNSIWSARISNDERVSRNKHNDHFLKRFRLIYHVYQRYHNHWFNSAISRIDVRFGIGSRNFCIYLHFGLNYF